MAANKFFQQELFKFSIFPKYQSCIDDLATNLADPEEWDFSDDKRKSHSILKNYLEHIFRKLRAENKICFTANNEYCCFNTGLVTKNLEEILRSLSLRSFISVSPKLNLLSLSIPQNCPG